MADECSTAVHKIPHPPHDWPVGRLDRHCPGYGTAVAVIAGSVSMLVEPDGVDFGLARSILSDLRSAGYVVLPRDLLDVLALAVARSEFAPAPGIVAAAAAVVEAVGPTREDTKA